MGTSWKIGKPETRTWVQEELENITSILDIGAGSGTYHTLLSPLKNFNWSAIEAWKPYIEEFEFK
jgi:hypothetical protein